jgi:hypothetical protein
MLNAKTKIMFGLRLLGVSAGGSLGQCRPGPATVICGKLIGRDYANDYRREDFTQTGQHYDLIAFGKDRPQTRVQGLGWHSGMLENPFMLCLCEPACPLLPWIGNPCVRNK